MTTTEILSEFRRGLEEIYGDRLYDVILFGSRARGDADPDSDYDVLVVLRGEVEAAKEIERTSNLLCSLCLEHDLLISSFYVPVSEFLDRQSPLLINVRREGVPV